MESMVGTMAPIMEEFCHSKRMSLGQHTSVKDSFWIIPLKGCHNISGKFELIFKGFFKPIMIDMHGVLVGSLLNGEQFKAA